MSAGGGKKHEVHAELVLDDAASATLVRVAQGFGDFGEKVGEVHGELRGMVKQAAAVAIGFQFDHGIESLKELAHEAYAAADGAMAQQKALAGILAISDKTGGSFSQLQEDAVDLHGDLEDLGIVAGVATDQVIESFGLIAERSDRTKEAIFELTGQMAWAGKAMPGGVEQIAAAFRDLETGIVRPRNALVMLIKQTGTVRGSAKDISKYLSALMQTGDPAQIAKAYALAEQAIGRMSDKMHDAPPSWRGTVQSLKDIRENIYEALGVPVLQALTPPLARLKGYFVENREEIERWAHVVGVQVGDWMIQAADNFKHGFEFVQAHAAEIKEALVAGGHALKDAIEFMVAHRAVLTAINVARAGASVAQGLGLIGGGAGVAAAAAVGGEATAAAATGSLALKGAMMGLTAEESAAAAAAGVLSTGLLATVGAAAAAAASIGAAGWQFSKLWGEMGEHQDEAARMEALERAAREGNASEARRMAIMLGELSAAQQAYVDGLVRQAEQSAAASAAWARETMGGELADLDAVAQAFEKAKASGDEARQRWLLSLVEGSAKIEDGFFTLTDKGLRGAEMLEQALKGVDFAGSNTIHGAIAARQALAPAAAAVNLNIGHMTVHQDFKDQDPDRVVALFRKDVASHAVSRAGSIFDGGGF